MLLVGSLGAFACALSQSVLLGLDMISDRKALFRERAAGTRNVYTLKVLNMDERSRSMTSTPRGSLDWTLPNGPIEAEAGAVLETPVRLIAEESRLKSRSTPVTFVLIGSRR